MPKLKKITFDRAPKWPGIRAGDLTTLDCDNPPTQLCDWKIVLRGQTVYFVSPPGWTVGENRATRQRDPKAPSVVYEAPRDGVFLEWHATGEADIEALMKGGKFESDPLGWKPLPVEADKPILAQIPPGQMGDA